MTILKLQQFWNTNQVVNKQNGEGGYMSSKEYLVNMVNHVNDISTFLLVCISFIKCRPKALKQITNLM